MGASSLDIEQAPLKEDGARKSGSDKCSRRMLSGRRVPCLVALATLLVIFLVLMFKSKPDPWEDAGDLPPAVPSGIVANDLWGIRDLLLVGYAAVFMVDGSSGKAEVRQHVSDFALMLPHLHPHEPCRLALGEALARAERGREEVFSAASAAWSCLPAQFTADFFKYPFDADAVDDSERAYDGRMPTIRDPSLLGVCRGSQWPRACSYWVSMHLLAYRADALGMGESFLRAITAILAGGATMCGGCTLHFRALNSPALSLAMVRDFGDVY